MSEGRVLVVDDDRQIVRALRTSLQARGYEVTVASNGETALDVLASGEEIIDLMLLDLGLPGIDGQEVIERVRGWSEVPIIVLSVREDQEDKVHALDAGADDYVAKPFGIPELLARMRAVQRRRSGEGDDRRASVLVFGELELDLGRRLVRRGAEVVHLTPTEYRLLEVLATNPGKLLTHRLLLGKIWGPNYSSEAHYLRVYIRQLRRKLGDDAARPKLIMTEPGLGYRWKPVPDESISAGRADGDALT